MCRSVPQTLATRTFTSTSRSPKVGTLTSRISAPAAASAFTTAVIVFVSGIEWGFGLVFQSAANPRFYTLNRLRPASALRRVLRLFLCRHALVEVLALSFRNAERLPLRAAEMLGEEDKLTHVIRVVRDLTL